MKTIKDFNLNNKKILIRVDFNVPIKNGIITDDTRIKESLTTIRYAIEHGGKIILLSHLGRVKCNDDKIKYTLKPISECLSKLLEKQVIFIPYTRGKILEDAINNLDSGEVLLVENTRFEDLNCKKESNNDIELGKYWASLGDIYINDAFGTLHREHASNVGIATNLPSGIGFLIEKELNNLLPVIENPKRPLSVILGGSKVSDKILVIENLVNKADYILIGGGMAFTFLKAKGVEIGKSLLDFESIDFCKSIMNRYKDKIILPIDVVTNMKECFITDINPDEIGYDIGNQTLKLFKQYLEISNSIIWNGPLGVFEDERYSKGTKGVCEILSKLKNIKIAGGGDTAGAIIKFGFKNDFTHISTGGGASLKLLEGTELPGLKVIK